ncbi:hypothetical protein [Alloactinosynnema sp. L-07]|uniref:hypothetical protein n=1 Tax=Alloactinosynnema sp. L-07 TaxID=1653480 RepID=UPI00065EEF8C|nr:hypothetical protein [Alloactinosynnema sp. L-07]CRK56053.1 hypothetical protein [Alloactinosynnema sp. L-07]
MNVDELLERAGEHWRAEQPPPPDFDFTRFTHRRRWTVAAAATAAAAVVITGVAVLGRTPAADPASAHQSDGSGSTTSATDVRVGPEGLIVRDGMTVRAQGRVVAAPGKPVRFCAPTPITAIGGGPDPYFADCQHTGVTVTGVDLAQLTDSRGEGGTVAGGATLTGVYTAGVVRVTLQGPLPPATVTPIPARPVPCAAPPGGWSPTGLAENHALHDYLEQQGDNIGATWVGYPDGPPTPPTGSPGYLKPAVMVIEVVAGDIDRIRAELDARYAGDLCVVAAPPAAVSKAEASRIMEAIRPIMEDRTSGIYTTGGGGGDRIKVELVMVDQRLFDRFAAIGIDRIDLEPWLRPV